MDEPNFLNHKEVHAYVESTTGENNFFFFLVMRAMVQLPLF